MENGLNISAETLVDYEDAVMLSDEELAPSTLSGSIVDQLAENHPSPGNICVTSVTPSSAVISPPAAAPTIANIGPSIVADGPAGSVPDAPVPSVPSVSAAAASVQSQRHPCCLCQRPHPLYFCGIFRKMVHEKRLRTVVIHRCCSNCLGRSHATSGCSSIKKCRECGGDHHTLLHPPRKQTDALAAKRKRPSKKNDVKASKTSSKPKVSTVTMGPAPSEMVTLQRVVALSPTVVAVVCLTGRTIPVRALLDPCSTVSRVCESLVRGLHLPVTTVNRDQYCTLTVRSTHDPSRQITLTAQVGHLGRFRTPTQSASNSVLDHFDGFQLADPHFYRSSGIAMVFGPEVYPQVLRGRVHSSPGIPLAQLTVFGWVISGPYHL